MVKKPRGANRHQLKTWPQYFAALWAGAKTFEIRRNMNFKVHDEIVLMEYDPDEEEYTGREIEGFITYLTDFAQKKGYVVFSFEPSHRTE